MLLSTLLITRARVGKWVLSGATWAALAGCQKAAGPTRVSGQVTELSTGQPVPNAQVYLTKYSGGGSGSLGGAGGGGYSAQGAPYLADGQGRFAFTFNAEAHGSYALRAQRTYYLNGPDVGLQNGQVNEAVRVRVYATAWLRLQLVDAPPTGDTSSLYLAGYEGPGERLTPPHDTLLVRQGVAGFTTQLRWSLLDSRGVETFFSQNVQLRPLDTVTVRIPF